MKADVINKHLKDMIAAGKVMDIKAKGAAGEAAVMEIVHEYRSKRGGILKQGFMYPYASNRQSQLYLGNIFWNAEEGRYVDVTRQFNDEIDVLYISHHRIFPIEVKSYHDRNIVITNQWMTRSGEKVDKSPMAQAEKHARHLYHQLYDVIPDGDPSYICPMVCLVDECTVDDQRTTEMEYYMPVIALNEVMQTLMDRDMLHKSGYTLDLAMIEKKLKSIERERDL